MKKAMYSIINGSSFLKNTAILSTGVIVAQVIPIIAYPVISRLYLPRDFGNLSALTAITSILAIIVSLKYENSILIVSSKKIAANLIVSIILLSIFLLIITGAIINFYSDAIIGILNAPDIEKWIWTCPVCAFCIVLFNCFNEWCVRNGEFKSLSLNKIINGGSIPVFKILFAFISKTFGLIIGDLVGHIITGISCVIRALKKDGRLFVSPSIRIMKYSLIRYVDSPKYVLPAQLLNKFGGELPVFFIISSFSAEELGFYTMATMVLALPTTMISRAIKDTFRKHANDIFVKSKNCVQFYTKVFKITTCLSIIGFTLFFFVAQDLFVLVLGEEWRTAGYYAQILCPMIAINFVSEIGSSMYIISERMNLLLIWQMFYFILTLLSMIIGTLIYDNIIILIAMLMIFRSIAYLLDIFFTYRLSKYGELNCNQRT